MNSTYFSKYSRTVQKILLKKFQKYCKTACFIYYDSENNVHRYFYSV